MGGYNRIFFPGMRNRPRSKARNLDKMAQVDKKGWIRQDTIKRADQATFFARQPACLPLRLEDAGSNKSAKTTRLVRDNAILEETEGLC